MSDTIWLYLLTRSGVLIGVLLFILVLASVGYFIKVAFLFANERDDTLPKFPFFVDKSGYIVIITTTLLLLVPSKEDIMVMYAGTVIAATMDADRAKVISDKTIKVIEKKLDNELNK